MADPDAYVRELDSLTAEIKRLNDRLKGLREQKKTVQQHLYDHMVRKKIEKCGDYSIAKIAPKPKKPRKPESAKKADAIEFFRQSGIDSPEDFFEEFKQTQKYIDENSPHSPVPKPAKKSSKKSDKEYDPFLGF